jgi:hypothetical protein
VPLHSDQALCFFVQARLQVRRLQRGHLYFGVETWQIAQSEVSMGSAIVGLLRGLDVLWFKSQRLGRFELATFFWALIARDLIVRFPSTAGHLTRAIVTWQHLITPQLLSLRFILHIRLVLPPEGVMPLVILALQRHIRRTSKINTSVDTLPIHVTQVIRRQEMYTIKSIKF